MRQVRSPSDKPGGSRSLAVSVVVHILVGAALVRIFLIPLPFVNFFRHNHVEAAPVEHLSFVAVPTTAGPTVIGRNGGDGRPITKLPPAPLVAPTTVPSTLPPVPPASKTSGEAESGSGPVVGTGGPAEGVRPEFHDPRVWVPSAPMVSALKTPKARMDSLVTAEISAHNDSMAKVQGRTPGDWTFTHNGQKYGMDQQYIHLGPISIPNAVLALLPLNRVQGNPMAGAAEQTYNMRHDEIMNQAQRGMDEDEFRTAVRKLRERTDLARQHKEEQKNGQPQSQPSQPSTPPKQPQQPETIANDGGS
jgi:hypothetical protein